MASISSGKMANCDWLRGNFAGPLFPVIDHGRLRKKRKHFKEIFQSETVKFKIKTMCRSESEQEPAQKMSFTSQKIQVPGTRPYLMRLTKTKRVWGTAGSVPFSMPTRSQIHSLVIKIYFIHSQSRTHSNTQSPSFRTLDYISSMT